MKYYKKKSQKARGILTLILVLFFLTSISLVVLGFTTDTFDLNDGEPVITQNDLNEAFQRGVYQGFQMGSRELQEFRDRIEELENEVEYWQDRYYLMREYLEGIIQDLNEQILSQMSHVDVLHDLIIQLVEHGLGDLSFSDSLEFLQSLEHVFVAILGQINSDIVYLNWWLDEMLPFLLPPVTYFNGYSFEEVNSLRDFYHSQIFAYLGRRTSAVQSRTNYHELIQMNPHPSTWSPPDPHNPDQLLRCPNTGRTASEWYLQVGWDLVETWINNRQFHEGRIVFYDERLLIVESNFKKYDDLLLHFSAMRENQTVQFGIQQGVALHMLDGQITARVDFETRLAEVRELIENKGVNG
ncbi:MAG: hypothetical protein FWE22_08475 [Firmicutes bacterium]|nr:hypothetical protein [Bacillota bacterium]